MTNEQMKETYYSRVCLDANTRVYVCTDEVKETYSKRFQLVNPDVRLMQFANDRFGMTSDCYILYAVLHLGCPTKEAIVEFLSTLEARNPGLHIVSSKATISERLRNLHSLGLVMKFTYTAYTGVEQKEQRITLYVTTEDGASLVRQHLKKRLTFNSGFFAKHIRDLIGWSSAGYVGAVLACANRGFSEYLEGILRTKQMGAIFLSCEWKSVVEGVPYYVAFMPSYLEYDKSYMTEKDYDNVCATLVNNIKNYLNCRTQKGVPCVVVSVQDNSDLYEIALSIYASGAMNGLLDNIYFTGEGLIDAKRDNLKNAFIQIKLDDSQAEGYFLCSVEAPFIVQ